MVRVVFSLSRPFKRVIRFTLVAVLVYLMHLMTGCSSSSKLDQSIAKVVVDESSSEKPKWVESSKLTWEESGVVFFKSQSTVKGTDRVDGCFQLASLNGKQAALTQISEDVKGQIDNVIESISEDAENLLGQVRSTGYSGTLQGFKNSEQYYQRYRLGEVERIDCFILSQVKSSDYRKMQNSILNKVANVDAAIKQAIKNKQVKFFEGDSSSQGAE